jgi:hypothetical protein
VVRLGLWDGSAWAVPVDRSAVEPRIATVATKSLVLVVFLVLVSNGFLNLTAFLLTLSTAVSSKQTTRAQGGDDGVGPGETLRAARAAVQRATGTVAASIEPATPNGNLTLPAP